MYVIQLRASGNSVVTQQMTKSKKKQNKSNQTGIFERRIESFNQMAQIQKAAIDNISYSLVTDYLNKKGHAEIADALRYLKGSCCEILDLHGITLENLVQCLSVEQHKKCISENGAKEDSVLLDHGKSHQLQVNYVLIAILVHYLSFACYFFRMLRNVLRQKGGRIKLL